MRSGEQGLVMHSPVHPGVILREQMGEKLTAVELARHLGMTTAKLLMLLHGHLSMTAETAMKLSEAFPRSRPEFWLVLQAQYDLSRVRKQKRVPLQPISASIATHCT